jgi:hypothetical protein
VSDFTPDEADATSRTGMAVLMLGGVGVTLGILPMVGMRLPLPLPQPLWLGLSVAALVAGASFTWKGAHPRTSWKPSRPGRRFQSAVIYTRADCGLCREAEVLLSRYADLLPPIVEVDIDHDPELKAQFNTCVPVVELDGQVRFRGRVSEALLRRLIEGTPPFE